MFITSQARAVNPPLPANSNATTKIICQAKLKRVTDVAARNVVRTKSLPSPNRNAQRAIAETVGATRRGERAKSVRRFWALSSTFRRCINRGNAVPTRIPTAYCASTFLRATISLNSAKESNITHACRAHDKKPLTNTFALTYG